MAEDRAIGGQAGPDDRRAREGRSHRSQQELRGAAGASLDSSNALAHLFNIYFTSI